MKDLVYDDLFSRTFGYLRYGRMQLNREAALTALKLMEELLAAEAPDVMERVFVELPRRLDRGDITVPMSCPPINRGSISYRGR